jgi:8-oxo-dGTP diphosphatase
MEKFVIGQKDQNLRYDFRETCFGICVKNNNIMLVKKKGQHSLIGGGLEKNETFEECLKREFLEESGLQVKKAKFLCTIDCFWLAAGKYPLESLANIFIVDIIDLRLKPLEVDHELCEVPLNNAMKLLPLPYQKKAIEYFLNSKD